MTIPVDELLQRLSGTLRSDVAPAVEGEFNRTQTFMASVILEKLARQVLLGPQHRSAEQADIAGLLVELEPTLTGAPPDVRSAVKHLGETDTIDSLTAVVESLYEWGVDQPAAAVALAAIRLVMRRDIDRRMEIAR